jgi:hypothetical protein
LPALIPALGYVATAAFHVRKGFSWAEMRRVALWPPEWWAFWWPAGWRRPGDLWFRLPVTVRRVRVLYGILATVLLLAWPMLFRPALRLAFLLGFAAAWMIMTATMVFCAWWANRLSIPNNADLRSLFLRSTADRRFWRRPHMARRLLPVGTAGANGSPQTAAECVRQIVESTQRMTGASRDAGLKAAEVARLAFAAIEDLEREIASLEKQPGDAATAVRLETATGKRNQVSKGLDTLWREHARVVHEESAGAAQGLTEIARSLEHELEAHRPADAAAGADMTRMTGAEDIGRTR